MLNLKIKTTTLMCLNISSQYLYSQISLMVHAIVVRLSYKCGL